MTDVVRWIPAALFAGGAFFVSAVDSQHSRPLRVPLATAIPLEIAGLPGREMTLPEPDRRVAGVTAYLLRSYARPGASRPQFSLYVGFYDRQGQGKTIHSPKNCLPGAGWEPLSSRTTTLATSRGRARVNRYMLQRGTQRALVLYWYQGRGRVESNEYAVKWNLLEDAVLRGRTDEALVRVIVPVNGSEEAAFDLAVRAATAVMLALEAALPDGGPSS
jgi:EpsI family protein